MGVSQPLRHTGRRRRTRTFAIIAAAGFVASAGFVAWSVLRREKDAYLTPSVSTSFDLQEVPPSAPAAFAPPPSRAAGASPAAVSALVKPIPLDEMTGAPAPRLAGRRPPVVTAKAQRWARTHKVFAAFLKAPARLLAKRSSNLANAAALKAFLGDPRRVNAYLDSPLVRVALNSPTVTKALITDPGVVKAFLGTPAMQDAGAVRALLTSKLFKKILDCPGPQGALEDPAAIAGLVSNPSTLKWLGENPNALQAIAQAAPALAEAYAPKLKKRR